VDLNGEEVDYFMGSGAAIGLIGCVIGAYVPGGQSGFNYEKWLLTAYY
jgi:hypothetical protein